MAEAPAPPPIRCPVCDATVPPPPDVVLAELLRCRECGSELEVVGLDPLAVREAPAAEEDWGE